MDAANVDLKAFTEHFYKQVTVGHLQPVLDTLVYLKRETNVWFEITTLLIPGENDSEKEIEELTQWVMEHLGPDVPLHFTAFHPDFKLQDKPRTPPETLHRARALAMDMGLKYVYEGNIFSDGGNTICPGCKRIIIRRSWHDVLSDNVRNGKCTYCGTSIPGVFTQAEVERRRGARHLHPVN
jgi:pyruvate formate lyase activating enzyme